jgi:hypothetical protein
MKNKTLGIIGLFGAPFLLIGFTLEHIYPHLANSWFTGFWGLMYMIGWTSSIIGLQRMEATGNTTWGKAILWIVHVSLLLANVSNVIQLVTPHNKPDWFFYIDLFWPLSNILMLIVGIMCLSAKKIKIEQRYIPLVVGLWLPFSLPFWKINGSTSAMIISGIYSAIAWTLLASMLIKNRQEQTEQNKAYHQVALNV